jgi:hypothetical protein
VPYVSGTVGNFCPHFIITSWDLNWGSFRPWSFEESFVTMEYDIKFELIFLINAY